MRKITIDLNSISNYAYFDNVIRQGENLGTEIEFVLSSEFTGYKYLMLFQLNNKTSVSTSELTPADNKVSYVLTNAVTNESGTLRVELHAYNDTGSLIKTAVANFKVSQSINGVTEIMPEAYVPWYMETVNQVAIATQQAELAQSITSNFSNVTLPQAIADVELAGQNKVGLATEQANIATTKAQEAAQSASDASGSPKGVYATLTDLQTAFPTGNDFIYLVKGNIAEVASLTISAVPTVSGNITVTLNGVAIDIAVDSAIDTTTDLVATKIRNTAFTGWTTGGTGSTITFTCDSKGVKTDSIYSAGTTGATGTMTTTTQGVDTDNNWYYWNGTAWTPGGIYQSAILDAINASIVDAGNHYTSGNVEGALQEVGSSLDTITTQVTDVEKYTNTPIAAYTHTTNKEVAVSAVDVDTNTFTSVGHGLINGDIICPLINIDAGLIYPVNIYQTPVVWGVSYYVINKTDNTFQLSLTSGGAVIDLTTNANLDLTKWHFEKRSIGYITISNLSNLTKCKILLKGKSVIKTVSSYILPNSTNTANFIQNGATSYSVPAITGITSDVGFNIECEIDYTKNLCIKANGIAVLSNTASANITNFIDKILFSPFYKNSEITSLIFDSFYPANGTIIEVYKA
jgi:hypothetical protein